MTASRSMHLGDCVSTVCCLWANIAACKAVFTWLTGTGTGARLHNADPQHHERKQVFEQLSLLRKGRFMCWNTCLPAHGAHKPAPRSCTFCQIARGTHPDSKKVIYQDERVVVFRDKHPAALEHLQAVPRLHITNLDSLQPSAEDYALVEELWQKGEQVLEQLQPGAQHRFGFHRPPFNSVQHLHMHCIALPYIPWWRRWKYASWAPWWVDVKSALHRLEPPEASPKGAAAERVGERHSASV